MTNETPAKVIPTNETPAKAKSVRVSLLIAAMAFMLALLLSIFLVSRLPQGVLFPVRVAGHSMAPQLLGEHMILDCPDCGLRQIIESIPPLNRRSIQCSVCGSEMPLAADIATHLADRVVIDKNHVRRHGLERWAVVALPDPIEQDRLIVKRIAGLPNEHVAIVNGAVQIRQPDGTSISYNNDDHKSSGWWRLPSIAIKDELRSHATNGRRWENDGDSQWRGRSWNMQIDSLNDDTLHWLRYVHWSKHPGTRAGVIYDDMAYNVAAQRSLHPASSVSVSGRMTLEGQGKFYVRCETAGENISAEFDLAAMTWCLRRLAKSQSSKGPASKSEPANPSDITRKQQALTTRKFRFELQHQPGLVTFTVTDLADEISPQRRTISQQSVRLDSREPAGLSKFSIGASNLIARSFGLKVERPPHYPLDAPRPATATSWQLGEDEIFLLGDNAPVSVDSRHWPKMVRSSDIIGIVRKKDN